MVLSAKDANGLTALHKAAGLGNTRAVEYLLSVWPEAATEKDASGRTPLHYAASTRNNDRCFNLLVQAGADEETQDNVSNIHPRYNGYCCEVNNHFLLVEVENHVKFILYFLLHLSFQKQRVASFYKSKANHNELDRSFFTVVPDAPRIPQIAANEFDWNVINPDQV